MSPFFEFFDDAKINGFHRFCVVIHVFLAHRNDAVGQIELFDDVGLTFVKQHRPRVSLSVCASLVERFEEPPLAEHFEYLRGERVQGDRLGGPAPARVHPPV